MSYVFPVCKMMIRLSWRCSGKEYTCQCRRCEINPWVGKSHWRRKKILKWVDISFSRGSSWPRDRIWISCIAGRAFAFWATREAPLGLGIPHLITRWERLKTLALQACFSSQNQESHRVFQFSEAQQVWLSSNLPGSLESSWYRERSGLDLKWRIMENEIQNCIVFT